MFNQIGGLNAIGAPLSPNRVGGKNIYYTKWSGLRMLLDSQGITAEAFDNYVDTLLANGFTELRIDIPDYQDTVNLAISKAAVIRAVAKGVKVIWGVSSNSYNDASYTIIAENWATFRAAILSAATWAQANGVYEFQLGNEEECHITYYCDPGTMVRSSNVVTVTTPVAHGFDGTHQVTVYDAVPDDMNGTYDITVIDADHFSYVANGANGSNTGMAELGDIDAGDIRNLLKSVATDVQAIFTNGNVSLSIAPWIISVWVTPGRGDVDIIACNVYRQTIASTTWKTYIDALVDGFGVDHTYLSEFSLNSTSLDTYSEDEAVQAVGITEMIDYIIASGITRTIFYRYISDNYGVRKADGTYRKIWVSLLGSQLAVGQNKLIDKWRANN